MIKILRLFLACVLISCLFCSEIGVYQVLAMKENEKTVGSVSTSVHLEAALFSQNYARKLVLIDLSVFNEESYQQILLKKGAAILLIIGSNGNYSDFYQVLKGEQIQLPLYMVHREAVSKLIQELDSQGQHRFTQFIIKNKESRIIDNDLVLEDFYGLLSDYERNPNLPIIMLSSSYDAYTPSPELNIGSNQLSDSGKVLLNSMHRLQVFQQSNPMEQAYNVMFYLTSSRHNSYESLFNFLQNPSGHAIQYINKIEYVLHLETFNNKNIRVITNNNSDLGIQFGQQDVLLKSIVEVAGTQGREVSIQNQDDILLNKKYKTVILKDQENGLLTDTPSKWAESNIQLVQQLLIRIILKLNNNKGFIQETKGQDFVSKEIDYLFKNNLKYPTYIQKHSFLNQELFKIFQSYSYNSQKLNNIIKNKRFFTSQKSHLVISQSVSPFLDLYVFGGNCVWLGLLFFIFKSKGEQ